MKKKSKQKPRPKIVIDPITKHAKCSACGTDVDLLRKETLLFHRQSDSKESGGLVTLMFDDGKAEVQDSDGGKLVCTNEDCGFNFGRCRQYDIDFY